MNIGITGHKGRLGSDLVLRGIGTPVHINAESSIAKVRKEVSNLDVLIHCGAYTDVDGAETESGSVKAIKSNDVGTLVISEEFAGSIIYISTDFIFDGKNGPYSEKAVPSTTGIGIYGKTKRNGEQHILDRNNPGDTIVRTTGLYSANWNHSDFVKNILYNLDVGISFSVPSSLVGNPTYVPHLSLALQKLVAIEDRPRILNISGIDLLSRYEFALMIASVFGKDKELITPSKSVVSIAPRPHKGGLKLGLAKKLGLPLYSAVEGLFAMKDQLGMLNDKLCGCSTDWAFIDE